MTDRHRQSHVELLQAVRFFMNVAGQSTGRFNARQACLYTGLQLEELGEKIKVIMNGCVTDRQRQHLETLHTTLRMFAKEFRDGLHEGDILRANHEELIDADFDLAWVSVGACESTSIDTRGAFGHGTATNLAKFKKDEFGKLYADRDENGKVRKPADWQPPDFSRYVDNAPKV